MTWETFRLTKFWEIDVFIYALIGIITIMLLAIAFDFGKAWRAYRLRWKNVKPHYGTTYTGIKGDQAKPNISLRRTR